MDLFEAMETQRAVRRFRPDPVPDEAIQKILHAATRAPSGGNAQPWTFIVIRDPEVKRKVGAAYQEAAAEYARMRAAQAPAQQPPPQDAPRPRPPTPMAEVPVLIVVCRRTLYPPVATSTASLYASLYPAVQNMLLAARALGLGTVLTTLFKLREEPIRQALAIPDDVEPVALIPLGYPRGRFGPVRRRPWRDVTFFDRWGSPPPD